MILDETKIRDLILHPQNTDARDQAIKHEDRIRFHVERYIDPRHTRGAMNDFLEWVRVGVGLPKDKYNIFLGLFRLPSPVVTETNTAFKDLKRVLKGRNPSTHFEFTDKAYAQDWEQYRSDKLKEPEVWATKGWEQFRTSINSVLVVDLPAEQTSDKPEPYFYWLDIRNVKSYALKSSDDVVSPTEFEYIMFEQPDNRLAVMDEKYSRVYQLNDRKEIVSIISEVEHQLGYTPARFFWAEPITKLQPGVKNSPITSELSNLDWYLFYKIAKRHLDIYASYPIYSAYEEDCDFENNSEGSYCDGGFLRDRTTDDYLTDGNLISRCPKCSERRLTGPGSFLEVPVPIDSTSPDLRDPVSITTIDKGSLDYNTEELERLRDSIHRGIVGVGGEVTQKQSINTQQVTANFESRVSVLNDLQINWESAQKFVSDTCCRYRYGAAFIESHRSLGTEFYVYSADDLYLKYEQAKKNGASEAELDAINDKIISAEYKDDPAQMQRMLVLRHLEPYRHYTLAELIELKEADLVDPVALRVKVQFNDLVERFERENTNVIEFGAKTNLAKKIEVITTKFKEYVTEQPSSREGSSREGSSREGSSREGSRQQRRQQRRQQQRRQQRLLRRNSKGFTT